MVKNMHKTAHHSSEQQLDLWQASFGSFSLNASFASPQGLLWGFSNLSFPTESVVNFQAPLMIDIESNELQLLQTIQLNPSIERAGVQTPLDYFAVDYF
jgi:hypothetical protein